TAMVSTLGFTSLVNVIAGAHVGASPLTTPGVLRVDVDPKPGPQPGNRILQPALGGLWVLSGFNPNEWVVSTSTGLWVVDFAATAVNGFVPTGLLFRGGDAQPTTLLGPPEAPWETDSPDEDFVTKCWE